MRLLQISALAAARTLTPQPSPSCGLLAIRFDARKFRDPVHTALRPELVTWLWHRLGIVEAAQQHRDVLALVGPPEQRRATVAAELAGRDVGDRSEEGR